MERYEVHTVVLGQYLGRCGGHRLCSTLVASCHTLFDYVYDDRPLHMHGRKAPSSM